MEEWRQIEDYPRYEVSTLGNVRWFESRERLKTTKNSRGYLVVGLQNARGRKLYYVHRLVALSFLTLDPDRPQVNHKDTDRGNAALSNLEWSTQPENVRHAQLAGLGEQRKPVYIVETGETFNSQYACAKAFGVKDHRVTDAIRENKRLFGFTIRPILEGAPVPDNTVTLEDVELIFRNFSGLPGMYNAAGDRTFAVKLPKNIADEMVKDGWNIKTLRAREEDEEPQPYIQVSVGYKGRPPTIIMITSRGRTALDEDAVDTLDNVDIQQCDLILRPYDWSVNGNTGRKAYLQSLYITVNEDPLQLKYATPATVDGPMMEKTGPYIPDATH